MNGTEGRCHGPGCTNAQTVPYWCSEYCSERWHFASDAVDRPASEHWTAYIPMRPPYDAEATQRIFETVFEDMRRQILDVQRVRFTLPPGWPQRTEL